MTLVYLNGGAPDYTGFIFNTSTELLDQIELTLNNAGWTTITKVVGSTLFIRGVTEEGTPHNCWVNFDIEGSSPNLYLRYNPALEEANTNQQGWFRMRERNATHSFIDGQQNRLWITADSESFVICIISNDNKGSGWHFGFCDRINTEDEWAIYSGELNYDTYRAARVAKLFNNPTSIWFRIGLGYRDGSNPTATSHVSPSLNHDLMTNCWSGSFTATPLSTKSALNSTIPDPTEPYIAHGRINGYNNKPLIGPYGLVEAGENTTTSPVLNNDNYEILDPPPVFRGWIKHAVTGLGGERTGYQHRATDGSRYLSVGPGWGAQGMKIKGAD